jgi:hypothetical protein
MGLGDLFKKRPATRLRTVYKWQCECGAHSRGGDAFEDDAKYLAQQHQWRKGVGHPMPDVYSEQITVPNDSR